MLKKVIEQVFRRFARRSDSSDALGGTRSLVLHEINELTGELERPVISTSWMVHIQFYREIQKTFEAFGINLPSLRIGGKEVTESEHVSHFGVVHLHIRTNFARRSFRIKRCEAVNDV